MHCFRYFVLSLQAKQQLCSYFVLSVIGCISITKLNKVMKFFFYVFDEDNDDNMRGWDPASEDDSNDNGMNRWSENNDEKGWW